MQKSPTAPAPLFADSTSASPATASPPYPPISSLSPTKKSSTPKASSSPPASSTSTTTPPTASKPTHSPNRKSRKGITTIVLGADGDSPWPIAPYLAARRANPPSLNIAMMAGHATIREQVMGKDFRRVATPDEIAKMTQLAEQAMNEGAIGLSSGLEYDVASYSSTDEVVAEAKVAGSSRRLLHDSHPRRRRQKFLRARRRNRHRRTRPHSHRAFAHQSQHRQRLE